MTRLAVGLVAAVGVVVAGPRCWLAAAPFALLFSAMLCLRTLSALLLVRPRRVLVFAVAAPAPLLSLPLAFLWLWTEVLRVLPESPQRLGQATLFTAAIGPGFAGLAAAALWLGQRWRTGASSARTWPWV